MPVPPVADSWARVETWLAARGQLHQLAAPATAGQLAELSRLLGLPLPAELAASLGRHDGGGAFCLPPVHTPLGAEGVAEMWRIKTSVWSRSPSKAFRPWYVPFAADGSGGCLYVDTRRGAAARIGQHDREGEAPHPTAHPMWDSPASLLHHAAKALETGEILDCYVPPGPDSDFLTWEYAADDED
ncbi:SMI1/KNR4 family protein [Streptomyces sp. NPDC051940]|uniref:SMI1/KNR4 family protein n=1 Tax=Streptomyces sp. NPDC051940 TaxID=3155675 RepID=UPI003439C444